VTKPSQRKWADDPGGMGTQCVKIYTIIQKLISELEGISSNCYIECCLSSLSKLSAVG
jgi:hypothetical protein